MAYIIYSAKRTCTCTCMCVCSLMRWKDIIHDIHCPLLLFYLCRTPEVSLTETNTLRADLVNSTHSDHSSHHSDSEHRLPEIEVSGEDSSTPALISDLTGGIRLASPPTTNLKDVNEDRGDHTDGNLPSGTEKIRSGAVSEVSPVISPLHSSSVSSTGGGGGDEANFAFNLKEKLLSGSSHKSLSTSSTPTGSRSPAKQPSPPRSVTPDPKRSHIPKGPLKMDQRKAVVSSTSIPKAGSRSPAKQVTSHHSVTDDSSMHRTSTNPFDSHSSEESMPTVSSATVEGQPRMVNTVPNTNSKHAEEERDKLAVAKAVALSKVSAKMSKSETHKKQPLTKEEKDMVALAKAVAVSEASAKLSKSVSVDTAQKKQQQQQSLVSQTRERKGSGSKKKTASSKPSLQNYIRKPRLDSVHLANFFQGIVAQDQGEVMMNVTWGGCNVPSSPVCEVEVGLITSDRAIYLLEVLDPEKHVRRPLSWVSENLPLAKIMSIPISTLSKITIGVLDQILQAEFVSKGIVKKFVVYPHSYEDVGVFVANLKAVLEASSIKYAISSPQELILSPPDDDDKVIFLNPDASDFSKLKEAIIRPKTVVQVGNYIASSSNDKSILSVSLDEEVRRVTDDICSKFEIEQYIMVAQISSDFLPIANDKVHLRSRVLILTNDAIYLCKEDFSMHPNDSSQSFNPPFPRCIVLDSHPLVCATDVTICERPQSVVPYTDPVFEFSILFEVVNNVPSTAKTTFEWKLCAQNKKRIEQFVSCLSKQLEVSEVTGLRITRTVDPISPHLGSVETSRPRRRSLTVPAKPQSTKHSGSSNKLSFSAQPSFFHSEMLTEFARLTNFQRLKFFKKHIAQAEFMKSDEVPLSIFLSHCSTTDKDDAMEIEACVLTSNYAIYLLSDLENIQVWVDGGGPISFQRRALLSKKDATHLRCFYRLWLTDIKEIRVGLFYLSVIITDSVKKNPCTFVIHTNIPSATVSLLSALSVSVNLRDSAEEEELSDLLSDYIDLAAESISKQSRPLTRPNVEFIQQHDLDVDKLKQMLLGIGPKIQRSRSIEESAASMQIFCQQVMLLVEDIRIRDSVCLKSNPHLVLLTNYGLFVCKNSNFDQSSPSVASPSDLQVRKWCHIDLVERVTVTSPETSIYNEHMLTIQVRSQNNLMEQNTLCLLVQTGELLSHFLHFLCHVWQVRSSRQLPIEWE